MSCYVMFYLAMQSSLQTVCWMDEGQLLLVAVCHVILRHIMSCHAQRLKIFVKSSHVISCHVLFKLYNHLSYGLLTDIKGSHYF